MDTNEKNMDTPPLRCVGHLSFQDRWNPHISVNGVGAPSRLRLCAALRRAQARPAWSRRCGYLAVRSARSGSSTLRQSTHAHWPRWPRTSISSPAKPRFRRRSLPPAAHMSPLPGHHRFGSASGEPGVSLDRDVNIGLVWVRFEAGIIMSTDPCDRNPSRRRRTALPGRRRRMSCSPAMTWIRENGRAEIRQEGQLMVLRQGVLRRWGHRG